MLLCSSCCPASGQSLKTCVFEVPCIYVKAAKNPHFEVLNFFQSLQLNFKYHLTRAANYLYFEGPHILVISTFKYCVYTQSCQVFLFCSPFHFRCPPNQVLCPFLFLTDQVSSCAENKTLRATIGWSYFKVKRKRHADLSYPFSDEFTQNASPKISTSIVSNHLKNGSIGGMRCLHINH